MTDPARSWTEEDGSLLRLRMTRPKANILDAEMIGALTRELDAQSSNPKLRGLLLDAEGPHFSFGASVEEHLPEQCEAMLSDFHSLLMKMLTLPLTILVVIRGNCLGGGLELACSGSLLFAEPDARMGQPEIMLGVFAPAASCLLPARIGQPNTEDLLFSGRSVEGEEALRIGLVNRIDKDPEKAALTYFREHLVPKSASSLRHAVLAVRKGVIGNLKQKLKAVEELYLERLMKTGDAVEGLRAFLEKRPPRWEDC
tara:strand:+ start:564 stop:1331 length:768 start_codon:yes stop_codon:yes gene_type:complete